MTEIQNGVRRFGRLFVNVGFVVAISLFVFILGILMLFDVREIWRQFEEDLHEKGNLL